MKNIKEDDNFKFLNLLLRSSSSTDYSSQTCLTSSLLAIEIPNKLIAIPMCFSFENHICGIPLVRRCRNRYRNVVVDAAFPYASATGGGESEDLVM